MPRLCVCLRESVLVSPGFIKVIDPCCSITRVGVATVTFGSKCHSALGDVSNVRPHILGIFPISSPHLVKHRPKQLTLQNMGDRRGGRRRRRRRERTRERTGTKGEVMMEVRKRGRRAERWWRDQWEEGRRVRKQIVWSRGEQGEGPRGNAGHNEVRRKRGMTTLKRGR